MSSNDPRGIIPDGAGAACAGGFGAEGAATCGCGLKSKGRSAGPGCTVPNPAFSTEAEKAEREAEDNMLRIIQRMR